jgi:hypothetical protein
MLLPRAPKHGALSLRRAPVDALDPRISYPDNAMTKAFWSRMQVELLDTRR